MADTAERGVPLPRTADRDDLQPMDLGEVWDLGDNVRLQRVYSPGTGPKHATAEHTLGPVDA